MGRFSLTLVLISLLVAGGMEQPVQAQQLMKTDSTVKGNTARPWTFWWWMGSAVNEADLTYQLEQFAKAGFGGVHVIPIYGVKGYEAQFRPFLSITWLTAFTHTLREANRLGLGVDVTTGTGWPFGGPNVTADGAAKHWVITNGKFSAELTKQQVKRAAPGGEGLVLDPFSDQAMHQYLTRFDSTLTQLPLTPRAVYNDSYEVYGANWTPAFETEFRNRHGYSLTDQLPAFLDTTRAETAVAVRRDYYETLADLLRDGFTATWTIWARQQGYKTRNQAHGSPGNLLDLYALADIPETESFGSSRFLIPGLRVDENYEVDRFGTPHPLAMKFASSAANLTGKRLVSSETGTWLANHFNVALSQIKPQIDELFTAGVNHIFYHGITYSPPGAGWPQADSPGWLFYASTNYGPSSHLWSHLPLLNHYVERCQTRLQTSQPDNDVLVYFPIHDLWAERGKSAGGVHLLEVHHTDRWLLPTPFGQLCDSLRLAGYSFDYVSDKLLDKLTVTGGAVQSTGSTYRVIVVPKTSYIPAPTRQRLQELARQGATVMYEGNLASLRRAGIRREAWAEQGLSFIRKKQHDTITYFIANLSNQFRQERIQLSVMGRVRRYDPLTDKTEQLPQQQGKILLHLEPGQSCFLTVVPAGNPGSVPVSVIPSVTSSQPAKAMPISGPWHIQFEQGRPALTLSTNQSALSSWTTLSDSAGYFWGTVRYTTTFTLPNSINQKHSFWLNLGDVREVAEVKLNGHSLGSAWCIPFQVEVPGAWLKKGTNQLAIAVTNVSANYMRLYDQQVATGQRPTWKRFYDINIVDIQYHPFDASGWKPMPSGLLGPVQLWEAP